MTKGLCFNYNENYTPGHHCKGCLFWMDASSNYLIELCDNRLGTEGELSAGEWSEIIFNPCTMRMRGQIGHRSLSILVDSRSTHNFVQQCLIGKLGIA